jgi:glycosyltransferase involved in cell wall biosynthesis
VTLSVPAAAGIAADGFEIVPREDDTAGFRRYATRFDVFFGQPPGLRTLVALGRADVRTVYDLYVPAMIETLGFHSGEDDRSSRQLAYQGGNAIYELALRTGDAFVCASERQRDLWLGALGALGRIDLETYGRDHALRSLIDVVPFGLEPEPPRATRPALKGVVPGIGEHDRVLLWAGGIWNWFDPLTLIRAVAKLAERRDDVKLYFLGVRHPNPLIGPMAMGTRAVALADELGMAMAAGERPYRAGEGTLR